MVNFSFGVGGTIGEGSRRFNAETSLISVVEICELACTVVVDVVQVIVVDSVVTFVLKSKELVKCSRGNFFETHLN